MWKDIKRVYADSWAFAAALPILFSIPALIEFAQHIVEIDAGMYRHGVTAAWIDQRRLTLGFAKTLALILPGYWFVRYVAWGRDAARAKRVELPAATLFGIQFAIGAALQWLALFGPPIGALLGLEPRVAGYVTLALSMLMAIAGIYLVAWYVAWPLGNARIGPLRSVGLIAGSFWRTLGYTLAGTLPLMGVHYLLGYGAIGRPEWCVWIMMALDALVVGFLALTMPGVNYVAAARAAARHGVAIDGGEQATGGAYGVR